MNWNVNKMVSYETGVHVGDGNMYSYDRTHRLTYSGNLKNEKEFYKFLSKLIKKTFSVNPILLERPSDNTVLILVNSKNLLEFKRKVLNLPLGPKDNIEIPKKISRNKNLVKWFMRGLGDTDFSLSFKKNKKGIHNEPRLEWYSKSEQLMKQVGKVLKKFGFTFSVQEINGKYHGYLLRMYGKRNLELWLKNFGFSNHWIKTKIKFWKKMGYYKIGMSYKDLIKILKAS